jgi:hypothetical protein
VGEKDSVRDVKKLVSPSPLSLRTLPVINSQIREARPQLKDRRVRLIHSGRLLTDGTFLYSWLTSLEERQKRAALEKGNGGQQPASAITWLHCSVGPKIETSDQDDEGAIQVRVF